MTRFKTARTPVFIKRCYLHIKADVFGTYFSQEKQEEAWRVLVDFEWHNVHWKNASRAYAMLQLASAKMSRVVPDLAAADSLLRQAYDLAMTNSASDRHYGSVAAHASFLRGTVMMLKNQWSKAIPLHERAEKLFSSCRPLDFNRGENLSALAACYTSAERHEDAAKARLKASNVNAGAIFSYPRPYL